MNCIQDDRSIDAETLSPSEATSFLNTIQTLPSADYRFPTVTHQPTSFSTRDDTSHKNAYANVIYNARDDAPSIDSAPSDEDMNTPFNICSGVWDDDDDATVKNHCACDIQVEDAHSLMHMNSFQSDRGSSIQGGNSIVDAALMDSENLQSRVSSCVSGCSVVTEMRDEFERGRDVGSPTRGVVRAVETMDVAIDDECVKQDVAENALVVAPTTVKKGQFFGMRRKFSKLSPLTKQKTSQVVTKEIVPKVDEAPNGIPDKEPAPSTLNIADKKTDEAIVSSSSICTASETVSTANTAPVSNKTGALKNMSPSKFLRSFKSKRSTAAATAAAAALAAAKSKHRVNFSDGNAHKEVECHPVASSVKDGSNASEEELVPVHLMSLTPDDIPMKYDEICYGPSAPLALATPAPLVSVPYSQIENSIVKTNTEMNQEPSYEGNMPNLSPIASKSYIKQAVTNDSVELDATGSITMTPDSTDYLNTSNETDDSLNDRCRSHLSGVSRTLFSDEKEIIANVEDIRFDGLGDDDVFECTLQNDELGVLDISVEGVKMEKQSEKMEEVMAAEGVKELNGLSKAPVQVSEENCEAKPAGFGNMFQMDMSAFSNLFGCTGSSSNVKRILADDQGADCDATKRIYVEGSEEFATAGVEKQHSCEEGHEYVDVVDTLGLGGGTAHSSGVDNDTLNQNGEKIQASAKQAWIKSMSSRTGSSLSMRKQSFGFGSSKFLDGRRRSQEVKLEILDEDIEATL
jgi:hypothetical protein